MSRGPILSLFETNSPYIGIIIALTSFILCTYKFFYKFFINYYFKKNNILESLCIPMLKLIPVVIISTFVAFSCFMNCLDFLDTILLYK